MAALVLLLPAAPARAGEMPPSAGKTGTEPACLSPSALVATPDGRQLFVACATADCVLAFDPVAQKVRKSISVPASPSGLALSPDGRQLFVTCAAPRSTVCVIDARSLKVLKRI